MNSCSGCLTCLRGKHILFVLILRKILCEVNLFGFRGLFINQAFVYKQGGGGGGREGGGGGGGGGGGRGGGGERSSNMSATCQDPPPPSPPLPPPPPLTTTTSTSTATLLFRPPQHPGFTAAVKQRRSVLKFSQRRRNSILKSLPTYRIE